MNSWGDQQLVFQKPSLHLGPWELLLIGIAFVSCLNKIVIEDSYELWGQVGLVLLIISFRYYESVLETNAKN